MRIAYGVLAFGSVWSKGEKVEKRSMLKALKCRVILRALALSLRYLAPSRVWARSFSSLSALINNG